MKIRVLSLLHDGSRDIIGAIAESAFTEKMRKEAVVGKLLEKRLITTAQGESAEVEVNTEFEEKLGTTMFIVELFDGTRVIVDTQITELA